MADTANDANNIYLEQGSTGLNRFGGWVHEEWLKDLYGIKGIKIYKEMRDNDPVIGAILFAIKMLIRQVSWRVDKASDNSVDQEAAEFLESCLHDMSMSWHDTIVEILSMLVFGWSYHEIVYKRRLGDLVDPTKKSKYNDGRIGWRKIPIRAQETFWQWMFDDDGGIKGMMQQAPPDYILRTIPIEKALLFRTEQHKNNPEGRSILRNAYRPWFFKKNIEEIEGIGIERDLAGLPVATVPPALLRPDATSEEKAVLSSIKKLVTSIRRDEQEGIVFPAEEMPDGQKTGYKLTLLSTGSRRQFDTNQIITRYNQQIAMSALADFIMLGQNATGSYALSSDKTDLFSVALGAFLDSISDIFNDFAIPRLFALNSFTGLTALPKLIYGDIETPDLTELGNYITALSGSGAPLFPDDNLENYLRQAANLPEKPEQNGVMKRRILKKKLQNQNGVSKRSRKPVKLNNKASLNSKRTVLTNKIVDELADTRDKFMGYIEPYLEDPKTALSLLDDYQFVGATFRDILEPAINDFYQVGWSGGKGTLESSSSGAESGGITLEFPEMKASQWAGDHAADLITQIDETTRDMIRTTIESSVKAGEDWETLQTRLVNDYGFSPYRAELIARTESGNCYNTGAVNAWQDSGLVTSVEVSDGDGCEACSEANGQIWSLEEALENPLEHPNCEREFYPILQEGLQRNYNDEEEEYD